MLQHGAEQALWLADAEGKSLLCARTRNRLFGSEGADFWRVTQAMTGDICQFDEESQPQDFSAVGGSSASGLTVRDVALRYRVGPDKVRAWIRRGELSAINTAMAMCSKPRWVVTPEALARFENGRRATPPVKSRPRHKRRSGIVDYYPD